MEQPADYSVAETEAGRTVILTGDWSALGLGDANDRLRETLAAQPVDAFDLTKAGRVDTAGALGLINALGGKLELERVKARPETLRLIGRINEAMELVIPEPKRRLSFNLLMERLGRGVFGVAGEFIDTLSFNGRLLVTLGRSIIRPHKVRWASVISVTERAGIDAIPIVVVANFFIGAVLAFLAAGMLADFGAEVFSIETVGFGVLREFGVVITAVLLAGRSASSFAAEIGSMKMQQEIDAMRVMGVDPFDALVLPRFLALLFIIPLTLLADIAGLFGGALVLWLTIDISPVIFMQRIPDTVGISQFWLGMYKAPVMAIVIAAIGCRQGMLVGGDVESLGRRVTSAVVQAIFSIIVIDAAFALIYLELDL
jgi:phospholipid/cholesterol/gamma-HCH transport system permease protein